MKTANKLPVLALLLTLCLSLSSLNALAGTLSSTVNRTQINEHETLALTVQYDDDADGKEPDNQLLSQDFSIVSRSSASGFQFINGKASRNTTWRYELMPRKTGKLLIPSFNIEGNYSEAITIEVSPDVNRTANAQKQEQLYTETTLDHDSVHAQEQAILTVQLVSRLNIDEPAFAPLQIDKVIVHDLGNRQYKRAGVNGGVESIIEQRYALFPQQAGEIEIPAVTLQVVVNTVRQSSMGILHQSSNQVRMRSNPQTLHVLPAENSNGDWLPAQKLEIAQELSGDAKSGTIKAGEAFTRVIRLRAEGLTAEQLPQLDLQIAGAKAYPENPKLENKTDEAGIIGTRTENVALMATQSGTLELPEIRVPWYDTRNAQWREAVLPKTVLSVSPANSVTSQHDETTAKPTRKNGQTPAAGRSDTQKTASPASTDVATPLQVDAVHGKHGNPAPLIANTSLWQAISAALLLLLIGSALWIARLKQQLQQNLSAENPQAPSRPTQGKHWDSAALQHACESGDITAIYQEILSWAQQRWPHSAPASLIEISKRVNDAALRDSLLALEKMRYGNIEQTLPDPATLISQLQALPDSIPENTNTATQLENLYR